MVVYDDYTGFGYSVFGKGVPPDVEFQVSWAGEKAGSGAFTLQPSGPDFTVSNFIYTWRRRCSEWGIPNLTQLITKTIVVFNKEINAIHETTSGSEMVYENKEFEPYVPPPIEPPITPPWTPPVTPPTEGGPIKPPTGGPTTPPPRPPASINPIDWLKWFGDLIVWVENQIWLGLTKALVDFCNAVWNSLPEDLRKALVIFGNNVLTSFDYLVHPEKFVANAIANFYKAQSQSMASTILSGASSGVTSVAQGLYDWGEHPIYNFFQVTVYPLIRKARAEALADLANPLLVPEELVTRNFERLADLRTRFAIGAFAWEMASVGQLEAMSLPFSQALESTGIQQINQAIIDARAKAHLLPEIEQRENALARKNLMVLSDYQRAVVREKMPLEEFYIVCAKMGISQKDSETFWKAHYEPPTLDDIITFNLRYPDQALSFDRISIISDLDPEFREIFEQRFFDDPTETEAQYMFDLGAIDEKGVEDILRRNHKKPADIETMKKKITRFQERRWMTRRILSLVSKYVRGKATDAEIRTYCKTVPLTDATIETILLWANDRKELIKVSSARERTIPSGTLDNLLYNEYIDSGEVKVQLEAQGYQGKTLDVLTQQIESNAENMTAHAPMSFWLDAYRFGKKTRPEMIEHLSKLIDDLAEIEMVLDVIDERTKARAGS